MSVRITMNRSYRLLLPLLVVTIAALSYWRMDAGKRDQPPAPVKPSSTGASSGGQFDFLMRFHPKVATSIIVTGPEHVERVTKHSFVFSPAQARSVLLELDKVLTKRAGWTRFVSRPGEYVVYERQATDVS